jgi:hypothetical protein
MATHVVPYNIKLFSFFYELPEELLLLVIEQINPNELLNFILTCTYFFKLVKTKIHVLTKHYSCVLQFPIERFMWSQFDCGYITDKQKLFLRMLGVHKYTKSKLMETRWSESQVEQYGALPTEASQLYIKKFQTGMLEAFTEYSDDAKSYLYAEYSYDCDFDRFIFLFKFITKYKDIYIPNCDSFLSDFKEWFDIYSDLTFEEVDNALQTGLSYNGTNQNMYLALKYNTFNFYLTLRSYGLPDEIAITEAGDVSYSRSALEEYNALRYIIGHELAYHLILNHRIILQPGNLQNILKLYLIGVTDSDVAMWLIEALSPDDVFESISIQMKTFGKVKYYEGFTIEEADMFNILSLSIGKIFAYYYVKHKFSIDIHEYIDCISNMTMLDSIGEYSIEVAEYYIQNPTLQVFEQIRMQRDTFGTVDINLL